MSFIDKIKKKFDNTELLAVGIFVCLLILILMFTINSTSSRRGGGNYRNKESISYDDNEVYNYYLSTGNLLNKVFGKDLVAFGYETVFSSNSSAIMTNNLLSSVLSSFGSVANQVSFMQLAANRYYVTGDESQDILLTYKLNNVIKDTSDYSSTGGSGSSSEIKQFVKDLKELKEEIAKLDEDDKAQMYSILYTGTGNYTNKIDTSVIDKKIDEILENGDDVSNITHEKIASLVDSVKKEGIDSVTKASNGGYDVTKILSLDEVRKLLDSIDYETITSEEVDSMTEEEQVVIKKLVNVMCNEKEDLNCSVDDNDPNSKITDILNNNPDDAEDAEDYLLDNYEKLLDLPEETVEKIIHTIADMTKIDTEKLKRALPSILDGETASNETLNNIANSYGSSGSPFYSQFADDEGSISDFSSQWGTIQGFMSNIPNTINLLLKANCGTTNPAMSDACIDTTLEEIAKLREEMKTEQSKKVVSFEGVVSGNENGSAGKRLCNQTKNCPTDEDGDPLPEGTGNCWTTINAKSIASGLSGYTAGGKDGNGISASDVVDSIKGDGDDSGCTGSLCPRSLQPEEISIADGTGDDSGVSCNSGSCKCYNEPADEIGLNSVYVEAQSGKICISESFEDYFRNYFRDDNISPELLKQIMKEFEGSGEINAENIMELEKVLNNCSSTSGSSSVAYGNCIANSSWFSKYKQQNPSNASRVENLLRNGTYGNGIPLLNRWYHNLQCVDFVMLMSKLYPNTYADITKVSYRDARDYLSALRMTSFNPNNIANYKVGQIFITTGGVHGHIGVVVGKGRDSSGPYIVIADSNYNGDGVAHIAKINARNYSRLGPGGYYISV
ncbi:CHAP domain-containing protein [bacterium]|nr:CHAP domain-containing protein [bacterium]